MDKLDRFLDRADRLMEKLERTLPKFATGSAPDWDAAHAFRWEQGRLVPVTHPHRIGVDDLLGIDKQKQLIAQNTKQFVQGRPANNVLLTGLARHRQVIAGQGAAQRICRGWTAPDRSRQAGTGRSAAHHRAGHGQAGALHPVLRRPVVQRRRAGLPGASRPRSTARWWPSPTTC